MTTPTTTMTTTSDHCLYIRIRKNSHHDMWFAQMMPASVSWLCSCLFVYLSVCLFVCRSGWLSFACLAVRLKSSISRFSLRFYLLPVALQLFFQSSIALLLLIFLLLLLIII